MKIKKPVEIDTEELAFELDEEEAIDLIKQIDLGQETLEFTEKALIHFADEIIKIYKAYSDEFLCRKVVDLLEKAKATIEEINEG